MRFVELIASEVAQRCAAPGVEGVRLSPLRLESAEALDLATALRAELGQGLHLAISAPGLEPVEEDRLCLSDGEAAARVATRWRNQIDSDAEDRIVYIAHKRWGRAGGLEETLRPITEADLRRAFAREATARGLDEELAAALQDANLLEDVPARTLCEFSERVSAAGDQRKAAGQNLPLLGLAQDSALGEEDITARLRANKKLVHKAVSGERVPRTSTASAVMAEAVRRDGKDALLAIDLGEYSTEELSGRSRSADSTRKGRRKKATRRKSKRRRRGEQEAEGADGLPTIGGPDSQADLLGAALSGTRAERESRLGALGAAMEMVASSEGQEEAADEEREELARLLGLETGAELAGLNQLAQALIDRGGWRLVYALKGNTDLRALLNLPLPGGVEPVASPLSHPSIQSALGEWQDARRALSARLSAGRAQERGSLRGLLRAPLVALAGEELHAEAELLLRASRTLYRAAVDTGDAQLAREVAALETATLRAGDAQLTVIGPLHPLWLGQAMARLAQVRAHRGTLKAASARLVARAMSRTPSAPQTLLLPEGDEARLAPVLAGLICYEARPALAEDSALSEIGAGLVKAILQVNPYAGLGLRVRLHGGAPGALIEGLARPLEDPAELARLEVCTAAVPGPLRSGLARAALEDGRLTFQPADGAPAAPHMELVLGSAPPRFGDDGPTAPSVAGYSAGPLATRFSKFLGGLRATTSVEGVPGVEEFEALHATAAGWSPRGAFIVEPRGLSLSTALRGITPAPSAWRVVIARGLARDATSGDRILIHDAREDGLTTIVVSDTTVPASRVLEHSLRRLEVTASSPKVRRTLADRLCETGRGLLTLGSRQSNQMAGLLLEAELRREAAGTCRHVTAALLRGQSLLALADTDPECEGAFCLCAGLTDRGLQLSLGYAAIEEPFEVSVARGGHLQEALAEALGQILEGIDVALTGSGVAQACAQESLRWALCPAAAEEPSPSTGPLLHALGDLGAEQEAEVHVRILLPPSHPLAGRGAPARLKGREVVFGRLDAQLLDRLIMAPSR